MTRLISSQIDVFDLYILSSQEFTQMNLPAQTRSLVSVGGDTWYRSVVHMLMFEHEVNELIYCP